MVFEVRTSTPISAPTTVVSSIVFDFQNYEQWNPFVRKISGDSNVGGKLNILVGPPGTKPINLQPKILKFEEGELRWAGVFGASFLLRGEHYFQMKPAGECTEFVHGENFTGLLSPLMGFMLGKNPEAGYFIMNNALKERAERASSSS